MGLAIDIILFGAGFVLLWLAADQFVVGAVRLAFAWRVSTVVIGAIIIGFGTSAPEIFVSGIAAAQGDLDIAVGNITGSNIANLTLVLGAVVMLRPVVVEAGIVWREGLLSAGAVVLFAVFAIGGSLQRWQGAVLVVALVIVLWIIVRSARLGTELGREVEEFADDAQSYSVPFEAGRTLFGLVGTLSGAYIFVFGATGIAEAAGLSEGFVGLTIVAIGTSLPELVTGVQAARKNETDLVVGNLLGSNIFNSLAVGGVAAFIGPGLIEDPNLSGRASYIMVGVAVVVLVMMATRRRIVRLEGAVLLAVYAGSLVAFA